MYSIGCTVFHSPVLVCVQLALYVPQDHTVQPLELGTDTALGQRCIADAEAVGIKKPLDGVFKHQSGLRLKAVKLTAVQNIQKFLFNFFVGPSVARTRADRLTDFNMTQISISFFFLTWRRFLRFWRHRICGS